MTTDLKKKLNRSVKPAGSKYRFYQVSRETLYEIQHLALNDPCRLAEIMQQCLNERDERKD